MKKIILAIAIGLVLSSLERVLAAGPFTVGTTNDTHATTPASSPNDASNNISLRSAIEAANAQVGTTTITVPPGTYTLTLGELLVAPNGGKTIIIQSSGTAADTIVSQANGIDRVFNIDQNSAGSTAVTISGLTIQGGHDAADNFGGAGILAGSTTTTPKDVLNLTGCYVLNNHCQVLNATYTGQTGGGVQMAGGDLKVTSCVFSNNTSAASQGGAIEFYAQAVDSALTITSSAFFNNGLTNTSGSGPDGGGAVDIRTMAGSVHNIRGSVFTGNYVVSTVGATNTFGGAIYLNTGVLNVTNSVFTGNRASGPGCLGGAIYVDSGTVIMNCSRLTGNVATSGGSALYNHGSNGAQTDAVNNWWGCNGGPGVSGCDNVRGNGATPPVTSPFLVLSNTASANPVQLFQTTTFTASFLQNSAGTLFTAAQIPVLIGLPVTWDNPVLGTLSGAQTNIQANGTATATFTAGHIAGTGQADAKADNGIATGSVTIDCPSITATVSGGASFCAGGAGVVQVDVAGGYPPYTVTLNNSGGTQTGFSPLLFTNSSSTTTIYQVVAGSDTNGCAINASGSATNIVFAAPDGTITVAPGGVCAGSIGNLAGAPTGVAGYAWTISNGFIIGATNAQSISYNAGSEGYVTLDLTVFSTNGCATVSSTNVAINLPPVTPTILVAESVCAGSVGNPATASNLAPGVVKPLGAPTDTYVWTIANGTITSATNLPTINFTAGSTGVVSLAVVVINASGCSASTSTDVAIAAHPTALVSGNATTITGSSTPLLAALTGTAPWTVTWSDGFSQTTNASPALHYVNPINSLPEPTNFVYTVTALTDASCIAGETDLSGSATVTVYSVPMAPTNTTATVAVCFQTPNPLLTVAVATNAVVDWFDAATGGNVLLTNSPSYTPTNSAVGTYTNFAQARDLTTDAVNTNRTPVVFTINGLPTAVVSGDATLCNGDGAVISAALTGVGPWTIQWSDGLIQTTNASPATRVVNPANVAGVPTNVVYTIANLTDVNCSANHASDLTGSATITVNPLPAAPLISTPVGVCAGSGGNSASGPTGATAYAWTISNGAIAGATNAQNIVYTAADSGLVTLNLTVFNTYGCSASTATNVTINPLPATPGINTAEAVCAGSSGNSASAISMLPGVVNKLAASLSYVWSITNGVITSDTNLQTITYTAGTNGMVGLTVIVFNEFGCSAGNETAVAINAHPTAVVSGDATLCNGDGAVISAALTGVSPWTIQWSDGLIQTTNASPATRVVNPVNVVGAPTNVVYTITNLVDANCSADQANDLTGSATITVNPLPAVPLISTPVGVCAGSGANSASGPAGATAYAWTISNGTITGATNAQSIAYTAADSGLVTLNLTVLNTYGCSASIATNVTINPLPATPGINTAEAVCAGSSGNSASAVSIVPAVVGKKLDSGLTFIWSITNGVITSDTNLQTITYTAGTNGMVGLTVIVFNEFGCSAGSEIAVPINALPVTPAIGLSPTSVCALSEGNIASGPAAASAYAWTISNGTITSSTNSPSITYTAGAAGSVALNLTVFNESGCSATVGTNVTINALPATPLITLSSSSLCGNSTGNTASGPAGASAYAWTIANGTITSATNLPTITYTAGASNTVVLGLTVFNESGCSTSVATNVVIDPDVVAPEITCPANIFVIVPAGTTGSNITFAVPVVDNCDPNPIVNSVPASGSTFLPGTTTVTVTAADHSGNTNTCQFTVRVHPEPTVNLVTPTNGSIFVVPQNISLLADAANPDATITKVDFYEHTNLLGTATSGYLYNWTNVTPGLYQLLAIATDDVGATGTSAVVNVSMLAHIPLPVGSIFPVETNSARVRQTGLLFQQVHVSNITPLTMSAIRLSISNLPPAVRVWNATGTNAGLPYLLYNQPILPGASVDFLIEYFVPDGHTLPNPTFICDLIPTQSAPAPIGTEMAFKFQTWAGSAPLVEFKTLTNRVYYIQYSPDLTTWKTALPAITGTGSSVQWIDNGPPKTDSLPGSVPARYYRVLLTP